MHVTIIMFDYTFSKGKRKTPLRGPKKNAKLPHQRNHVLSGQEEGVTQITPFVKE